VKHFIRYR